MKSIILLLVVFTVVVLVWAVWLLNSDKRKKRSEIMVVAPKVHAPQCTPPPMTGNLKVTTYNTKGDSSCAIRLGDSLEPIIGQPFSAMWNDAKIPEGGYILTWGPTALFYGESTERLFSKNLTVVTQKQFEEDGHGFAVARGGIIPCECCGEMRMPTPFSVTPIRVLHAAKITKHFMADNIVYVEFDPVPGCEAYVLSVEVKRDSSSKVLSEIPNVAYHGEITDKLQLKISLPNLEWSDEINFGYYDETSRARVFGYKRCDAGNSTSARAGNLAMFYE
jgi:hypothetical protein